LDSTSSDICRGRFKLGPEHLVRGGGALEEDTHRRGGVSTDFPDEEWEKCKS